MHKADKQQTVSSGRMGAVTRAMQLNDSLPNHSSNTGARADHVPSQPSNETGARTTLKRPSSSSETGSTCKRTKTVRLDQNTTDPAIVQYPQCCHVCLAEGDKFAMCKSGHRTCKPCLDNEFLQVLSNGQWQEICQVTGCTEEVTLVSPMEPSLSFLMAREHLIGKSREVSKQTTCITQQLVRCPKCSYRADMEPDNQTFCCSINQCQAELSQTCSCCNMSATQMYPMCYGCLEVARKETRLQQQESPSHAGSHHQPAEGKVKVAGKNPCFTCGADASETVKCEGGHSVCRKCVELCVNLSSTTKEKPICPSPTCQELIEEQRLVTEFSRINLDILDKYLRQLSWQSAKSVLTQLDALDFWCICNVHPVSKSCLHVCKTPLSSASRLLDISESSEEFQIVKHFMSSSGHWSENSLLKVQRLFSYKPMRKYMEKVRSLNLLLEGTRVYQTLLLHPAHAESLAVTFAEGLNLKRATCKSETLGKGLYMTSPYGFKVFHEPCQKLLLCKVVTVAVENKSQRSPDTSDCQELTVSPNVLCVQQPSRIYPQYLVTLL